MSRLFKFLIFVAIVALVAEGIYLYKNKQAGTAAAQGAAAGGEMPAMPVPVVTIAEKPVELWKEFSSRLTAVDYVEIRPQVTGIIQTINFQDGQIVKVGDVLFNIDPRPYEAAVAQARSEVASANEDAAFAQRELVRAEELLKTGAVSKQGYDQRVSALKLNKSARSGADARLKAALVDLDHASIKAPVSGRISRPEITEGNLVSAANAPLLTTIVSDTGIYADFEVDEQTYLSFVRSSVGQNVEGEKEVPVRLYLTGDDTPYTGTIKSFDNKINPSTGTIRARAIFSNEGGILLPGMFAKVQIGSSEKQNRITVPETAVSTDQNKKFVYIVGDGNAATYREVTLGDVVKNERLVISGLKPGDRVITDGIMKIRPGAKVNPMTPEQMEQMKAQMAQQGQPGQDAKPAEAETPKDEPAKEPEKELEKPADTQ